MKLKHGMYVCTVFSSVVWYLVEIVYCRLVIWLAVNSSTCPDVSLSILWSLGSNSLDLYHFYTFVYAPSRSDMCLGFIATPLMKLGL